MKKLLKYNNKNVHHFPKAYPEGLPSPQATPPEFITLVPGINSLSEKEFDLVNKHPLYAPMVEEGLIEEVDPKAKPSQKDQENASPDLAGFNAKESVQVIKKTMNPDLLEKWKNLERRESVIKAIDEQLKLIEEKTTPIEKKE